MMKYLYEVTYNYYLQKVTKLTKVFLQMQILSEKFDNDKSLTKNITAILKKFIAKDVAVMFNTQKKYLENIYLKILIFVIVYRVRYYVKDLEMKKCIQIKIILP